MKVKTAKRLIIAGIIAVVVTATISTWPPPPPEYKVTDLGFCGRSGHVSAINNAGRVTGWSPYYSGSPARNIAFVWDAVNKRKDIETPEGKQSFANDINDKAQVAGYLLEPQTKHTSAFIWHEKNGITELDTLGGNSSSATAINNKGQVVGFAETSEGVKHAFIWDKTGGMRDLATLGGRWSRASDINDKGQVVGISTLANGDAHGFIWQEDTGIIDLGTLGGQTIYAASINNSHQVVGATYKKGRTHGFIWEPNKAITELNLPGLGSFPVKINDAGQIIGYFQTRKLLFFKGRQTWFLWHSDRGIIELDAISKSNGAQFKPVDINNRGQIVGTQISKSGQNHIVILTPKPESKTEDR